MPVSNVVDTTLATVAAALTTNELASRYVFLLREVSKNAVAASYATRNWFATVANARLPELVAAVYRVLRRDRHFYLFCDEVTADVIKQQQGVGGERLPNGARRCESGFVYWKEILWAKTTLDGARIRGGTGYHYRAASERILFFEKGKRRLDVA